MKSFAEENQKAYQESNLIDLMNRVVHERRGDIFDDQEPETGLGAQQLSATGLSTGAAGRKR